MIRQHTVITPYNVGASHFYSTELAGELILFDTGPPTEASWQTLCREVDLSRLKHVFITHLHVDHCGQVRRIQAESGAVIYFSQIDARKLQHQKTCLRLMAEELESMGFNSAFQKKLFEQGSHAGLFFEGVEDCQVVEESTELARLGIKYLNCAGHCQSDIIYQVQDSAISGDILLPNFFQTPLLEIDLSTLAGRFDNYSAYCASLGQFAELRGLRIYPGHRDPFNRIDDVILYYVGKLRERAALVAQFPSGFSVREIVESLFGGIMHNPVVTFLKASEVVFMQDYLACPELLDEALRAIGLNGNGECRIESVVGG